MRPLYDAGYTDIGSDQSPDEHTYLFDGLVGSLDHGLGNEAALATVTGAHVWNLNSVEPMALEYSRHNYNATDFYDAGPLPILRPRPAGRRPGPAEGPVATQTSASVTPDPVQAGVDRPVSPRGCPRGTAPSTRARSPYGRAPGSSESPRCTTASRRSPSPRTSGGGSIG